MAVRRCTPTATVPPSPLTQAPSFYTSCLELCSWPSLSSSQVWGGRGSPPLPASPCPCLWAPPSWWASTGAGGTQPRPRYPRPTEHSQRRRSTRSSASTLGWIVWTWPYRPCLCITILPVLIITRGLTGLEPTRWRRSITRLLLRYAVFLHHQFTTGFLKQSINSKWNNIVSKGQRNDLRDFFELSTLSIISNIRCRRITFVAFVLDFGLKLVFKVLELYFRCYLDICKI